MRKKEKRLNLTGGGSLIEVRRGIEDEAQRMRSELGIVIEEERRTVAPWIGDVVNYWVCALLSAPESVRNWAAVEGRRIWDEHLASPKPTEFTPIPGPCATKGEAPSAGGPVGEARPIHSHGTRGKPGVVAPKDGQRKPKAVGDH